MFYRDFMQKYRPVYAAEDGTGSAAPAGGAAVDAAAPAAAAEAVTTGGAGGENPSPQPSPAGGEGAAAAPGAGADASKPEPSLLEAASGKKPDATAAVDGEKKDSPAPAEAAKPEGDKPGGEGDKSKPDSDKSKPEGDKAKPDAEKDAAKPEAEKKDATAEAQPPAPIKYDAFKLPDGVKLDDERIGKFTEVAGSAQVSQEVAQQFVDLHIAEMQRYAGEVQQQADAHQRDVWNKLNDTWKTELRKDEKLGGNRIETTLSMAKAVLEEYGGTPEQVQELIAHTSNNGMGNFPGFIRLLSNLGEALNVFEESSVGANLNPPKPQKGPGNRGWYKDMPGAAQP